MRNPDKTIQSTWLVMIALQAIGSIDSTHKLPSPKRFVAVCITWFTLMLIAGMGYAKQAAQFSLLLVLVGGVMGPFGDRLANFFKTVGATFGTAADSTTYDTGGAIGQQVGGQVQP